MDLEIEDHSTSSSGRQSASSATVTVKVVAGVIASILLSFLLVLTVLVVILYVAKHRKANLDEVREASNSNGYAFGKR